MKNILIGTFIAFSCSSFAGEVAYKAKNLNAYCGGDNFTAYITVDDLNGITVFQKEWDGYLMAAITQPFGKCLKLQKRLEEAKKTEAVVRIVDGTKIEIIKH
jgi:hypothetical protein